MEWSIADSSPRYSVKLRDTDGTLTLTDLQSDGNEQPIPNISIRRDEQVGRLLVEVDGSARFAHAARVGDSWWIHMNGRIHVLHGHQPGSVSADADEGGLSALMPGTILEVLVKEGQRVREGQTLLVMEAMKMEHRILAPKAGEVLAVNFAAGDRVDMGATLVELGD